MCLIEHIRCVPMWCVAPQTDCKWLRGPDSPCPFERFSNESGGDVIFVLEFQRTVAVGVEVVRLVEQIPSKHALVIAVTTENFDDIRLKPILHDRGGQYDSARALHPAAIV